MEKPILFCTEMVRAILDGRKTQTRRLIKGIPLYEPYFENVDGQPMVCDENGDWFPLEKFSHIQPGDVLWVRETWNGVKLGQRGKEETIYWYRADENEKRLNPDDKWRPSIHMPREAARLFLRVTNVRVERLQDISSADIDAEGCKEYAYSASDGELLPSGPIWFRIIWDKTIKTSDQFRYCWDANPWVWVIEFERINGYPARLYADMDTARYADAGALRPAT